MTPEEILALYPECLRIARPILRNEMEAEEAALDALFLIWHRQEQFEGRSTFVVWAKEIAVTASLMRRRVSWVRKRNRFSPHEWQQLQSRSYTPEQELLLSEAEAIVRREIRRMPKILREPIEAFVCDEESLGVDLTWIRNPRHMARLHRGRRFLAVRLKDVGIELHEQERRRKSRWSF